MNPKLHYDMQLASKPTNMKKIALLCSSQIQVNNARAVCYIDLAMTCDDCIADPLAQHVHANCHKSYET